MMITVCCVAALFAVLQCSIAAAGDFGYNKISGMCTLHAGWSVRRAYAFNSPIRRPVDSLCYKPVQA